MAPQWSSLKIPHDPGPQRTRLGRMDVTIDDAGGHTIGVQWRRFALELRGVVVVDVVHLLVECIE